ncbi:MAG: proline--tRNA ligase [Deltaproteobacteria bacterium]|nr:proline--tRNA ligase [Deltaproteobacteria bacterium]
MKLSRNIGKTCKDDPKEAQTASHRLLLRGGYIKQVSAGLYACMPLFVRTLNKLIGMARAKMNQADGVELSIPVLQPKELWTESQRWAPYTDIDGSMFSFRDRRGSYLCLGLGAEEALSEIMRREINSYKQLSKLVYQIRPQYYDDIRPRFGLIRPRESTVCEAYGFEAYDVDPEDFCRLIKATVHHIGQGLELKQVWAESLASDEDGGRGLDLVAITADGEDRLLLCEACGYTATIEKAESKLPVYPHDQGMKTLKAVYGPGLIGVDALAEFLKIPVWVTTKTLIFQADEKVVAVMVRGDCDVNEAKVKAFLKCYTLTLAAPDVIKELTDAEVGYAGPINLPKDVTVLADHYTNNRVNFECGANRTDYHYINANFGRDFPRPIFGDFKLARPDQGCPRCHDGLLTEVQGMKIGQLIQSRSRYSDKFNCTYLDADGKTRPVFLSRCGLDLTKMIAAVVEQHHDRNGILWPTPIAPFLVHLVGLNLEKEEVRNLAEELYRKLQEEGLETLFDDRDARAGEKFGDADLLGLPVRLAMSKRTATEKKVELKLRAGDAAEMLTWEEAIQAIKKYLD